MLEDYRAGLTIDREHEDADRAAGRRIASPTLLIWSLRDDLLSLYDDPLAVWRPWTIAEPKEARIDSGHHVAEEASGALVADLREFLSPAAALPR
ncbi:hypothetical protein [Microbacterium sp. CIAB417]|uniref:hypothetical protein n=1 Tax=Microbacterium sp. CIAB417 TaxID=2860287 RepID=UPI001FAE5901|nr:hypothetical protein [Microbacterium sp. CIAB417]